MDAGFIVEMVLISIGFALAARLLGFVAEMLITAFGKTPVEERQPPIEIDLSLLRDAFHDTLDVMIGGGTSRKRKNDEVDERLNEILHDPLIDEKPKRVEEEETEWYVGDDGELFQRKRKR